MLLVARFRAARVVPAHAYHPLAVHGGRAPRVAAVARPGDHGQATPRPRVVECNVDAPVERATAAVDRRALRVDGGALVVAFLHVGYDDRRAERRTAVARDHNADV